MRRAIGLGAVVLLLIGLIFGVKACRDSAHDSALRTYDRDVAALLQASERNVARPLFRQLTGARGHSPLDVETQVNNDRVLAEEQASRARSMSVPGEVAAAQRDLVLALDLRTGAIAKIADKIRTALGSASADVAVRQIAGQMQAFLASDVLVSQRVAPLVAEALRARALGGPAISGRFLPNLGWLNPDVVAARLGGAASSAGTGTIAPGTHGHALTSVAVGLLTLQTGTTNQLPFSADPVFAVKIQNQGSNTERDVVVQLRITGAGTPISVQRTIPRSPAGQITTTSVPLGQAPPVGTPVTITVTVKPVPGEHTVSNNTATYTAVFTR